MNRFFVIFVLIVTAQFSALSQSSSEVSAQVQLQKLEWILGKWNRTNVRQGTTATETWTKVSNELIKGIGLSMQGNDTTFVEQLRIEVKDNHLYYVADVKENASPTYFKITSITDSGFVSENPAHDFPKVISYELKEGILTAIISDGDKKKMGFIFRKN